MSCRARGGAASSSAERSPPEKASNPVEEEAPLPVPSVEQQEAVVSPPDEGGGDGQVVQASSMEWFRREEAGSSPPVVLLDDGGTVPAPMAQITFGFDVNEQLVRMFLEGGMPSSLNLPPRPPLEPQQEELGRFNHRDVVDFLGCEWNRAYQSYERDLTTSTEGSLDCRTRILYYCDSSHSRQDS